MLWDVALGVLGNIVFATAGYFAHGVRTWLLAAPFRSIFPNKSPSTGYLIFLSTREGPLPQSTPRVSLNEVASYADLQKVLRLRGTTCELFRSAAPIIEAPRRNIISLGGPAANPMTKRLLSTTKQIPYHLDETKFEIVTGKHRYKASIKNNEYLSDFAIIAKIANPFQPDHFSIILAGCHGRGTEGAVELITSPKPAKLLTKLVGKNCFAAVVKTTFSSGAITDVAIEECVILP